MNSCLYVILITYLVTQLLLFPLFLPRLFLLSLEMRRCFGIWDGTRKLLFGIPAIHPRNQFWRPIFCVIQIVLAGGGKGTDIMRTKTT